MSAKAEGPKAVQLITELKLKINEQEIKFEKDKIGEILKSDENALNTLSTIFQNVDLKDDKVDKQTIEIVEYTVTDGDTKIDTKIDKEKHGNLNEFLLSQIDDKVDEILNVVGETAAEAKAAEPAAEPASPTPPTSPPEPLHPTT